MYELNNRNNINLWFAILISIDAYLVKGYSNKKEFILLVIRNVRIVRCFVTIESVCFAWLSGEVS